VKKITFFCIFVSIELCILCIPLCADSAVEEGKNSRDSGSWLQNTLLSYTLSLNAQFGLLWGQAEEQVYDNNSDDRLISQLLWDLKSLWYAGTELEFSQKNPLAGPGVFGVLSVKFGVPGNSGAMEDRDWLAAGGALTNYSLHNNLNNGTMFLDLLMGFSVPLRQFMVFRLLLGPSYLHLSWSAYDGYYRYGKKVGTTYMPLADSDPRVSVSGAAVSYSQDWLLLLFNLSALLFPDRLFSGTLFCSAGPMLRFVGRDDHHMRDSGYYGQFVDEISGGYALEPGGEFRFSPTKNVSLALHFSWRRIVAASHGNSFARYTGSSAWDWDFLGNISGGGFQTMDLGIGLKVCL
jgi:outer membrane protease